MISILLNLITCVLCAVWPWGCGADTLHSLFHPFILSFIQSFTSPSSTHLLFHLFSANCVLFCLTSNFWLVTLVLSFVDLKQEYGNAWIPKHQAQAFSSVWAGIELPPFPCTQATGQTTALLNSAYQDLREQKKSYCRF